MSNSFLDNIDNARTKYDIAITEQFKRDYKLTKKRGLRLEALAEAVTLLANGEALPEKNRDHALSGDYEGFRECHIASDWLLIYRIEDDVLVLVLSRTGVCGGDPRYQRKAAKVIRPFPRVCGGKSTNTRPFYGRVFSHFPLKLNCL